MLNHFAPTLFFLILLLSIFISDRIIDYFLLRSFVGSRYRFFVAPGIVLHELSHALFAVFLGCRVTKINVTSPQGGFIIHTKPKYYIIQTIIAFAPIIGVTFSFYFATFLLAPQILTPISHPDINSIFTTIKNLPPTWQTILYLYLTLSFAAAFAPSRQDLSTAIPGIIIICSILLILSFTPIYAYLHHIVNTLRLPVYILYCFLILAIMISLILFILTQFLHQSSNSGKSRRK